MMDFDTHHLALSKLLGRESPRSRGALKGRRIATFDLHNTLW